MIYANHNFLENYASAEGRKDDFMKNEIIIDEVNRTILNNKIQVVKLLRNNGINATHNDCADRLLELVLMQFEQNPTFSKAFSNIILDSHKEKYHNATDTASLVDSSVSIADSLKSIGGRFKKKKKGSKNSDADKMRERLKLAETKMNGEKKGWVKWAIIGTSAAILVTIAIILIRRRNASNNGASPITSTVSSGSENNDNGDE